MKNVETLSGFARRTGIPKNEPGKFNAYKVDAFFQGAPNPPLRRDYYKISLVCGSEGILSYADKVIRVEGNALIFGNPMVPYTWKSLSKRQSGYFCIFTEDFLNSQLKAESLSKSPLFMVNGNPVLFPTLKSAEFLTGIFEQMLTEIQSSYFNKYELLRNYVQIILHESLKMEPPVEHYQYGNSSGRITDMFLQLLDRQFPITSPQHILLLKTAGDYAAKLSIHTNHLTKSVREATGKSTSVHIAEKMIFESKSLLLHSNWDVAQIGYCLGFTHASNFDIFFKKHTGETPGQFRRRMILA